MKKQKSAPTSQISSSSMMCKQHKKMHDGIASKELIPFYKTIRLKFFLLFSFKMNQNLKLHLNCRNDPFVKTMSQPNKQK